MNYKITTLLPFNTNEIKKKERHSSRIDVAWVNITLLTFHPFLVGSDFGSFCFLLLLCNLVLWLQEFEITGTNPC
jgi:hypothetical protein